jgi:uncharacterized protein
MPANPIQPFPLWATLTLALALSSLAQLGPAWAQQLVVPLKDTVPTITTNGEASAEVVPDIATIAFAIDTERPKAADAARENARAAQAVVAEIKAEGIEARDIKTVSVTLAPVYDEVRDANGYVTKRTLRGYSASNSLKVRMKDIAKAGALASQMLDKGVNRFYGITYEYSQKDEKYDLLRTEAVQDALRRANGYVNGLGIRLGRILEIIPQPHAVPFAGANRMPAAAAPAQEAAPAIPVEPGIETLRTEVQVIWELAQ